MSDRRRATLLEDLPDEIVVDQILVRLPSKDVGRCRAVSTSWKSATSTSEFMLEHHRRQPSLPIIDGGLHSSYSVVLNDATGTSSQQLWPFPVCAKYGCRISAACDGFLIVSPSYQFYICNPVTRKRALLPEPELGEGFSSHVNSFYRHHPTGEYRVLFVSRNFNFNKYILHILTVGSDEPRHVPVTMPAGSSPCVEQNLLMELFNMSYSICHRGSLHWCPHLASVIAKGGGGDIIVFDTEAESFRWMRAPAQLYFNRKLFNMKGMLAFWGGSTTSFNAMDIWVMQDYEDEIWTLMYRFDVSMLEASRQIYLTSFKKKKNKKRKTPLDSTVQWFDDMAVLNERELLIKFNEKYVLRCDIDGNFLGIVNLGKSQYRMSVTEHRFQESIVPIPYHEMQEEDEESPFSTGHV